MDRLFENFEFTDFQLIEADGSQNDLGTSPNGVLGIVKGPSFFLDGFSRNKRFYPREAWENALQDSTLQRRLERGLVFGCIGHPVNYTLDELLASGKVSHKVTDIRIDESKKAGIATYEILDTPAGRILYTVLKSGSKLYVSTRAFGTFKANEFVEKDGEKYRVIDPKSLKLESIDFVIEPGFLETDPKLQEQLKEDLAKLQDTSDGIICVDGLCSLKQNEAKKEEPNEITEPQEQEPKEEIDEFDENILENLTKEELKQVIKGILKENKKLLAIIKESDLDSDDDEKDNKDEIKRKKELLNAYLETLARLIKWNESLEKIYLAIENFLNKAEITETDFSNILKTIENLENVEGIDDSVLFICEKIKKLLSDEQTQEENIKETLAHFINKINTYKEQLSTSEFMIERLKEGMIKLAEKADEKNCKEQKVENKIDESVVADYKSKIRQLQEELEKDERVIERFSNEIDNLKETLKHKNEEVQNLKEALIAEQALFEKRLKEKESEINSLKEELNKVKEEYDKKYSKLEAEFKEHKEAYQKTLKKYYMSIYRVDESVVEYALNKYQTPEKIAEYLKSQEKAKKSIYTEGAITGFEFVEKEVEKPRKKILAEKLI